jgi:ADP-ribose pyrophosphatase YjhB (NUDIX family)
MRTPPPRSARQASGALKPFPVAIKGVVVRDGRVLLLRRGDDEEWELPGGWLDAGEMPSVCVVREIADEVGWTVTADAILDAWLHHTRDGIDALIVTYGCHAPLDADPVGGRDSHQVGLFTEAEVALLHMPEGYKLSIAAWYARLRAEAA